MADMTRDETWALDVLRSAAQAYEATAGMPDDAEEDGMTRALRRAVPEAVRLIERQQAYIAFQRLQLKGLIAKGEDKHD